MAAREAVAAQVVRPLSRAFPQLRFLPFAFCTLWADLMFNTGASVGSTGVHTLVISDMAVLSTVGFVAVPLVAALLWRRIEAGALFLNGRLLALAACAAALGTAGVRVFAWSELLVLFNGAAVLTGLGTSWLFLAAMVPYAGAYPRRAFTYAALSKALASLMFLATASVPPAAQTAVLVAMPFASAACLSLGAFGAPEAFGPPRTEGDASQGLRQAFSKRQRVAVVKLVAVSGVLSFTASFTHGQSLAVQDLSLFLSQNVIVQMGAFAAALAFAAAANLPLMRSFASYAKVLYAVGMALIAAMLLSPFAIEAAWLQVVSQVVYSLVDLLLWCLFAGLMFAYGVSVPLLAGWGRFAFSAGTLGAWAVSYVLFVAFPDGAAGDVAVVVMTLALIVGVFVVFRPGDFGVLADLVVQRDQEDKERRQARALGVSAKDVATDAFADELCLTAREREVYAYLVRGRSASFIAETLCVSVPTVKTHVRGIYAKAGVRSKGELLDALDERVKRIPPAK
ncbi:response regulator transcription factor [Rubneribacter sp.]|nr:helix-turn-helix transcriptional regulator [Candidatus Rubneribacter avistercoris]